MIRLLIVVFIVLIFASCNSSSDTSSKDGDDSAATKKEEWVRLFDGKTTAGWHNYGKQTIGKSWKVQDSALFLDVPGELDSFTLDGGDIVTDNEYENFDLKLEWKISPAGNSGIMINVNEDTTRFKTPWQSGPEIQVLDNKMHPDALVPKRHASEIYDLISANKETVKPAGEWNLTEIMVNNGKLDVFLNNEKLISTTMWNKQWDSIIAISKFKAFPGFGTFRKGKIGLQDHGADVWFKNIIIKTL
jgi:hypothetical protein